MQFLRALVLGPMSLRPHARKKGGGVIFDFTVIALGRVIGPNTRFIDTRF